MERRLYGLAIAVIAIMFAGSAQAREGNPYYSEEMEELAVDIGALMAEWGIVTTIRNYTDEEIVAQLSAESRASVGQMSGCRTGASDAECGQWIRDLAEVWIEGAINRMIGVHPDDMLTWNFRNPEAAAEYRRAAGVFDRNESQLVVLFPEEGRSYQSCISKMESALIESGRIHMSFHDYARARRFAFGAFDMRPRSPCGVRRSMRRGIQCPIGSMHWRLGLRGGWTRWLKPLSRISMESLRTMRGG